MREIRTRFTHFQGEGLNLYVSFNDGPEENLPDIHKGLAASFTLSEAEAKLPNPLRWQTGIVVASMAPPHHFATSERWRPLVELMDLSKLLKLADKETVIGQDESGEWRLVSRNF